jgi:hypothetical protein
VGRQLQKSEAFEVVQEALDIAKPMLMFQE